MDELIAQFDEVEIRGKANFGEYAARKIELKDHRLFLEFPALELLSFNVALPHLDPPIDVAQRQRPPNRPNRFGVYDTSFFVVMPLCPNSIEPARFADGVEDILSTTNLLPNSPGKSSLKMVAYHDSSGKLIHRFRLFKQVQRMKQTYEFELDKESYGTLMNHLNDVEWVFLLHHLLLRASDRAYYHVKERLEAKFGKQITETELMSWPESWYERPPRRPKEILISSLELDIVPDSKELGLDSIFVFKLACGHKWAISKRDIISMTATDCLQKICGDCSVHVWNEDSRHEHRMRLKNDERDIFECEASFGSMLDEEVSTNAHQILNADLIHSALIKALPGLTPPPLLCPPSLSPSPFGTSLYTTIPSRCPKVRAIGDVIGSYFSAEVFIGHPAAVYHACRLIALMAILGSVFIDISPDDLPLGFKENIERSKMCDHLDHRPPGFSPFIVKWIKRAVNCVHDEKFSGRVGMRETEGDSSDSEDTRLEENGEVVDAMLQRAIDSAKLAMMKKMMQNTYIG